MDKVIIKGLEVTCVIGVNDWERESAQKVIVDLELFADLSKAVASDDIADAPDYNALCGQIVGEMSKTSYSLLESFAAQVADICLQSHGSVRKARITVSKPYALRDFGKAQAYIETTRTR